MTSHSLRIVIKEKKKNKIAVIIKHASGTLRYRGRSYMCRMNNVRRRLFREFRDAGGNSFRRPNKRHSCAEVRLFNSILLLAIELPNSKVRGFLSRRNSSETERIVLFISPAHAFGPRYVIIVVLYISSCIFRSFCEGEISSKRRLCS